MNAKNSMTGIESRAGYWRRVLRPLFWWLLLVLFFFVVHQHQLAMERTRIYFSPTMYGTNALYDAVATLDGQPVGNGDKISLGSHQLTITQSKAETFSANFFAWYGRHDFGKVNLVRATGILSIFAEATAGGIQITGPEFHTVLYNSTGTNLVVPTDTYHVSARYRRWSDVRNFAVTAGNTTRCVFAPQLSMVSVVCDRSPATYELQDATGNIVEQGDVPALITEVPGGRYFVLVKYRNHALKQGIDVLNTRTNEASLHFAFGAARFESVPSGASIYAADGTYLGTTPVVATELPPSTADYRLQLDGYDAATVSVTVAENETNTASATLVSLSYLGSMRNAKDDMKAGNYKNALASIAQALSAKPGDSDALNLQTTAQGRNLVQNAKVLASQDDYLGAGKQLQNALAILPNDTEAKALQASYKTHEPEQVAQLKEKQVRTLFEEECKKTDNAQLFAANEYMTGRMSPEDARNALVKLYADQLPKATVSFEHALADGIYVVFFVQSDPNPLVTARREMLCVIGPTKDGQTIILFKCLEYQKGNTINLSDLLLHGKGADWIPLHPSRIQMTPAFEEQVQFGVRMMTRKIKQAAGESTSF